MKTYFAFRVPFSDDAADRFDTLAQAQDAAKKYIDTHENETVEIFQCVSVVKRQTVVESVDVRPQIVIGPQTAPPYQPQPNLGQPFPGLGVPGLGGGGIGDRDIFGNPRITCGNPNDTVRSPLTGNILQGNIQ